MKIEAGKYYETVIHKKAIIYQIYPEYMHGAIDNDGYWTMAIWLLDNGEYSEHGDTGLLRIIGEWKEPSFKRLAYINSKGSVHLFCSDVPLGMDWKRVPHLDEPKEEK